MIKPGDVFGQWTVIEKAILKRKSQNHFGWLCRCSCGVERKQRPDNLVAGRTTNCGCVRAKKLRKHGYSNSTSGAYRAWVGMKTRCTKRAEYLRLGIKVCDRWSVFTDFLEDMGEPALGMSLDRIDGTKGYSPDNCKWSTIFEQNNNRSNVRRYPYLGELKTVPQLALIAGMPKPTIEKRLKAGWSAEKAVSEPSRTKTSKYYFHRAEDSKVALSSKNEWTY